MTPLDASAKKLQAQLAALLELTPDPRSKYLPETTESVFQSLLAVPLIAQNKVIGALDVPTRTERAYSEDEIELLSTIANVAASELQKVMLYDEIGGLKEAMETRKLVERAKGILMKQRPIDEQDAFARIQHQARTLRKTMRAITETIILADQV
jgi:signal transduction protein with GAF and PtsI domain